MFIYQQFIDLDSRECDRAWVEINLKALVYNVKQLTKLLSPSTNLMAIVKADAYGHGAIAVAKTVLNYGATSLGVATITEGIKLRKAGIQAPILILGATNTPQQVYDIVQWKLYPTICAQNQAIIFSETLAAINHGCILPIHLKIDTGMSRLGIPWQETNKCVKFIQKFPNLKIAGIYSHFANADSIDLSSAKLQHYRYQKAIDSLINTGILPTQLHLANSAATLTNSELHYDLVRVGLAIYGLYPAAHLENKIDLRPVLQVKARITQIKMIQAGSGVSYGYQYIAEKNKNIAVIGIGYADGVPRNLSNRMDVLIRGQRVPQIGNITMDKIIIDVSNIYDLKEGEVVTLIGRDGFEAITVEDWAALLNTISWEIICGFRQRLPRIYLES